MRARLPLILAATALAVAVLGSTQAGQAAYHVLNVVPRALFADNAGKLDGHVASVTPRAGQIPVLDSRGQLSQSIVPAAAGGSSTAGALPRAFEDRSTSGAVTISTGGVVLDSLKLPVGHYFLLGSVELEFGSSAGAVTCYIGPGGTDVVDQGEVGNPGSGAKEFMRITLQGLVHVQSAGSFPLTCDAQGLQGVTAQHWVFDAVEVGTTS